MRGTRSKHRLRRGFVVVRGTWVIDLDMWGTMGRARVPGLGGRVLSRLYREGLFCVLLGLVPVSLCL